ncbi:MAG: DUF433 domain-containing protein [Anaerolineaceae bacterium]|nr:DUF433 domain-containing protein [Anaerolineaceae bacterium]
MIETPATIPIRLWKDDHEKIRIGGTRVLLELVIHAFNQGEMPEAIQDSYPTLSLAEVYAVIACYLTHRAEVDSYMREADAIARRIQQEAEVAYGPEVRALHARLRGLRDK